MSIKWTVVSNDIGTLHTIVTYEGITDRGERLCRVDHYNKQHECIATSMSVLSCFSRATVNTPRSDDIDAVAPFKNTQRIQSAADHGTMLAVLHNLFYGVGYSRSADRVVIEQTSDDAYAIWAEWQ